MFIRWIREISDGGGVLVERVETTATEAMGAQELSLVHRKLALP